MKISFEILDESFALSSNSPTGLIWKFRPREHFVDLRSCNMWNTRYAGNKAGALLKCNRSKCNYWQVRLLGKTILCHRAVYILHHGVDLPDNCMIDHIDTNGENNNPDNLRQATSKENSANTNCRSNNKTGLKGASKKSGSNKFVSQIYLNGKKKFLGYYDTAQEAHNKYQETHKKEFGKFANLS